MLLWEAHTSRLSFLVGKKNQKTPLHPWKMPKPEQKEKCLVRVPPRWSWGLSGRGWYPLCIGAVLASEGGLALPARAAAVPAWEAAQATRCLPRAADASRFCGSIFLAASNHLPSWQRASKGGRKQPPKRSCNAPKSCCCGRQWRAGRLLRALELLVLNAGRSCVLRLHRH